MFLLHFSTGRQFQVEIFYVVGLIFYSFSTGTKACVAAADLIDSNENLHCFMWPLSSCYIKISVASCFSVQVHVRILVALLSAPDASLWVNNGRTVASSAAVMTAAVSWRHHAQEMIPMRFEETAQSEQPWHSCADIEGFICCKLTSINECTSHLKMTKDGRERYVLQNYKQNKNIMTMCVIILVLPERTLA